ncbi:hypothetical protein WJX72_000350 [[Myrmecia] bisecta]|uniref:Peptidase M14 domain-containing protein n=1 Tax=[Myrmecia] bisecta TaxID=41462 RepID=A0AAW1QNN5_9CHLO
MLAALQAVSNPQATQSSTEAPPCLNRAASLEQRWAEGSAAPTNTGGKHSLTGIYVNSHFDSGNVEVVDMADQHNIQLRIHEDPFCESDGRAHFQWFHFRVTGVKHEPITINLMNAGDSSFPRAWNGYNACASYDRMHWFRVPSSYDSSTGVFTIKHKPERNAVYFAYAAPYPYERHQNFVAEMQSHDNVELEMLGETLDGHDLDLLRIGDESPDKRKVWVIGRQHPGEAQAQWFVEGFLRRLLDPADPLAKKALRDATFYVVPNMNPDGSWRGHLRTNAAGANLNREWQNPSPERSPEVFLVRDRMDAVGVDMLLDVHADEELPYNFINGNEGNPNWSPRLAKLQDDFGAAFERSSPDFQRMHGYETDAPGTANQTVCAHAIGMRFDCLSLTLEQPFKDTIDTPDPVQGWSAERSCM